MATVRSVIRAATEAGSRQKRRGSMSAKTGVCAGQRHRVGRGGERERRHDDLVAGPEARRQQAEVQARGA